MICKHCSHEVPDDAVFCTNCGNSLSDSTTPTQGEPVTTTSTVAEAVFTPPVESSSESTSNFVSSNTVQSEPTGYTPQAPQPFVQAQTAPMQAQPTAQTSEQQPVSTQPYSAVQQPAEQPNVAAQQSATAQPYGSIQQPVSAPSYSAAQQPAPAPAAQPSFGAPQQATQGQPFGAPQQATQGSPYGAPQQPAQPYGTTQVGYPTPGYQQPVPPKKSKTPLFIGIGAAVLVVIVVAVLVISNLTGGGNGLVGRYELTKVTGAGITMQGDDLDDIFPRSENYLEIVDSNTVVLTLLDESARASYSVSGDTLTIRDGSDRFEVRIDGDVLVLYSDGYYFYFTKAR